MGIHQTFGMPVNCIAPSSFLTSASQSSPFGHSFGSFSVTTVSNIESGAGSVGESNRPALPNTRSTSGNCRSTWSCLCSTSLALASLMPGTLVGM